MSYDDSDEYAFVGTPDLTFGPSVGFGFRIPLTRDETESTKTGLLFGMRYFSAIQKKDDVREPYVTGSMAVEVPFK